MTKVEKLGRRFKGLLDYHLPDDAFIAGGAVRDVFLGRANFKDIDVFSLGSPPVFSLKPHGWHLDKEFTINDRDVFNFSSSDKDFKLQWIRVPYKNKLFLSKSIIEDILSDFDFTCTQWAFWPKNNSLIFTPQAIVDSVDKSLSITRITYPVDSLRRMFLYRDKGYSIDTRAMIDFVLQTHAIPEEDLIAYMYEKEDDLT
jgi:hypothetical protein